MERDQELKETQDRIWKGSEAFLDKVRKVYDLFKKRLLNAESSGLSEKFEEIDLLSAAWMSELNSLDDCYTTVVSNSSQTYDIKPKKNLIVLGVDIPYGFLNTQYKNSLKYLELLLEKKRLHVSRFDFTLQKSKY